MWKLVIVGILLALLVTIGVGYFTDSQTKDISQTEEKSHEKLLAELIYETIEFGYLTYREGKSKEEMLLSLNKVIDSNPYIKDPNSKVMFLKLLHTVSIFGYDSCKEGLTFEETLEAYIQNLEEKELT